MTALNGLKANNILYRDIQIDCTNISTKLTSMMNDGVDNTNSLPINSQNNNTNSDNFVNVGVNSLTNNILSNNREIQNEEEVEDPLNERAVGYVRGKIFRFSRMKPEFTQLCV